MIGKEIREILMTVREFKAKMSDAVKDSDSLLQLGVVDSFGLIQLVAELEARFSIVIEPDDLQKENFESIDSMVGFIEAKRA